jgi:hypothetical protein
VSFSGHGAGVPGCLPPDSSYAVRSCSQAISISPTSSSNRRCSSTFACAAAEGRVEVPVETYPLREVAQAWAAKADGGKRVVVTA